MKYLTIALSLAAAVIAQSPTAMAQDASAKAREMFIKADTNQDGALSLEEWKAAGRRDRGFAMIDADKDGKITLDEMKTAFETMRQRRMRQDGEGPPPPPPPPPEAN